MAAILDIEVRKGGARKGRGWALRYAPDGSRGFVTLPKLPRGVQQGRVSFPVGEGLVYMEDCHGARFYALVRTDGSVAPLSNAQAVVVKREVGEWVGRSDLPATPPKGIARLQTDNRGWVARIVGRDPKWGVARQFLTPCDARSKVKVYDLPAGVYEWAHKANGGGMRGLQWVTPEGEVRAVDRAWLFDNLDAIAANP